MATTYELLMIGRYITEHQDAFDENVYTFAGNVHRTPYTEHPLHYLVIARGRQLKDFISELPFPTQMNLETLAQQLPDLTDMETWYRDSRSRAGAIFANLILSRKVSCWVFQRRIID